MCLFHSAEAYLEQRDPITTFNDPRWRKYSIQKLTQLSQGEKVQDAAASNIDFFPWNDTWVSSTQLNSPYRNKMSLSPP
jgi:hypothetical protein